MPNTVITNYDVIKFELVSSIVRIYLFTLHTYHTATYHTATWFHACCCLFAAHLPLVLFCLWLPRSSAVLISAELYMPVFCSIYLFAFSEAKQLPKATTHLAVHARSVPQLSLTLYLVAGSFIAPCSFDFHVLLLYIQTSYPLGVVCRGIYM